MNKTTFLILMIITLILTACSGTPNTAAPASGTQGGPTSGELSAPLRVAIGTLKLDGTAKAVTAKQAAELLPLWETLKDLYSSDTAATEEVDALVTQIQETMTANQIQAITAMNLTRQDMFSVMQSQGVGFGGAQNGNTQSNSSSNNNGGNFRRGGDFAGGPPPDGGAFPGGGANFQGQGNRAQSSNSTSSSTASSNTQRVVNPNRIPTPLVQAVIDYLKTKANA